DEDHPVDPILEQRGERSALAPGLATAGTEQKLVAELGGELLDPSRDLGEERVAQVVKDHSAGLRSPAGQAARHRVGPVAEARHGGAHARGASLADVRLVTHDERYERA